MINPTSHSGRRLRHALRAKTAAKLGSWVSQVTRKI